MSARPERLAKDLAARLTPPSLHDVIETNESLWNRLVDALASELPNDGVLTLEAIVARQDKVKAALKGKPDALKAFMELCNHESTNEGLVMEAGYLVGLAAARGVGGAR